MEHEHEGNGFHTMSEQRCSRYENKVLRLWEAKEDNEGICYGQRQDLEAGTRDGV
jgi:hypothetical protein